MPDSVSVPVQKQQNDLVFLLFLNTNLYGSRKVAEKSWYVRKRGASGQSTDWTSVHSDTIKHIVCFKHVVGKMIFRYFWAHAILHLRFMSVNL